jgi:hypothetical protein
MLPGTVLIVGALALGVWGPSVGFGRAVVRRG